MTSNRYEIDDEIYLNDLLTIEDVSSFVKYLNNPTLHANTLKIPYPYTQKDGEDFIKRMKSNSPDSTRLFTIRLNSNNELIGECSLNHLTNNERRMEIGYWLGEPYWRRGIMPKVIKKVLEIIKTECKNVVRIEAKIFTWNKASMRVVEKCGFVFEGVLRKYVFKNGKDLDVNSYALIIEDN